MPFDLAKAAISLSSVRSSGLRVCTGRPEGLLKASTAEILMDNEAMHEFETSMASSFRFFCDIRAV